MSRQSQGEIAASPITLIPALKYGAFPLLIVRTCHFCGIRAPQPEMIRDMIYVESGQSRTSITGATIIGAAAGSKAAKRAIERSAFGASNRTHLRKREVWRCDADACRKEAATAARQSKKEQGMPVWVGALIVIGALLLYAALAGGAP